MPCQYRLYIYVFALYGQYRLYSSTSNGTFQLQMLFEKIGEQPPAEMLRRGTPTQAQVISFNTYNYCVVYKQNSLRTIILPCCIVRLQVVLFICHLCHMEDHLYQITNIFWCVRLSTSSTAVSEWTHVECSKHGHNLNLIYLQLMVRWQMIFVLVSTPILVSCLRG